MLTVSCASLYGPDSISSIENSLGRRDFIFDVRVETPSVFQATDHAILEIRAAKLRKPGGIPHMEGEPLVDPHRQSLPLADSDCRRSRLGDSAPLRCAAGNILLGNRPYARDRPREAASEQ